MVRKILSDLPQKIIAIFIGIAFALILLELLLRLLPVSEGRHQLAVNDSNPIPRFEENRDFIWSADWNFSIVIQKHSNNYGFLNDQDYSREDDSPLMAIIGDSFVEAMQVENKVTMHGILARELAAYEGRVYSFGVAGEPLSTYLVTAKYVSDEFNATSMVFIIVGNDFDQSLAKYYRRPGLHQFHFTDDGELVLKQSDFEPSIVTRWGRKSALLRYLDSNVKIFNRNLVEEIAELLGKPKGNLVDTSANISSERISDSKKAVDEFFNLLPSYTNLNTENILFIVDAMRPEIYSDIELKAAQGSYSDIMRRYFIEKAMENSYEVIYMEPIFINRNHKDGSRFDFETDGHWNALGHKLIAEAIQSSAVYTRTFDMQ